MRPTRRNKVRDVFTIESLETRRLMAVAAFDETTPFIGDRLPPIAVIGAVDSGPLPTPRAEAGGTHAKARPSDPASLAATKMSLVGEVPGGMRGEQTTFTVVLRDAAGKPLPGQRIAFSESYGGKSRVLDSAATNESGQATLTYRISLNPSVSNVSLTATFGGSATYKASSYEVAHVEIGRKSLAVEVSGPTEAVDEGSSAVFTFRLSESAKVPVTVSYATADRSATAGADYVAAVGSVTFAPGQTARRVAVATLSDSRIDTNESFVMGITSVEGAKVGSRPSAIATIRDATNPPNASMGSWTVFVYMTGSNLNDYARDDINEMEKALTSLPADVRIVVSWDQPAASSGIKTYATGGGTQSPWGTYGRSVLTADANMSSIASTFDLSLGERNTGAPSTLVDFLTWGVQKAPAENYMLQMWGHGGGFQGSQFDTESKEDALKLDEMASALSAPGVPPIKVLAYDNCLMGMAEVGAAIAPSVSGVFVASEELVAGPGQDYTTSYSRLVTADAAGVTSGRLSDGMVASFQKQYQGNSNNQDTLSAVSTTGYGALNAALARFVSASSRLGDQQRDVMLAAAKASPEYGSKYGFSNVDLAAFMSRIDGAASLPGDVRGAANEVKSAIASMVSSRTADKRGSGGIAVFLPTEQGSADLATYATNAAAFCRATGWDKFARWMATGSRIDTPRASSSVVRAESSVDRSAAMIPQALWATYAMDSSAAAHTRGSYGIRRSRS